MKHLSLNGSWRLKIPGRARAIAANVPGCLHTDLMEAGILKNPAYRDNIAAGRVGLDCSATYEKDFSLNPIPENERIFVCLHGIDTFATVFVNGVELGRTSDMFHRWRFEMTHVAKSGPNHLAIVFDPPEPRMEEAYAAQPLEAGSPPPGHEGFMHVRKRRLDFGGPGTPPVVTVGLWHDVQIGFANCAFIENAVFSQRLEDNKAVIDVDAEVDLFGPDKGFSLIARAVMRGGVIAETRVPVGRERHYKLAVTIDNPRLWWPCGMGEQPLYEINIDLVSGDGHVHDYFSRRIGICRYTVEVSGEGAEKEFHICVNGRRMLVRGTTWTTPDILVSRPARVEYARLIKSANLAGVNMLRLPGYGMIEKDFFYDLCDEYGISVWHDFMFSDAAYPVSSEDFVKAVAREAEEVVPRLSTHACLAVWCGGDRLTGHVAPEGSGDKARMDRAAYETLFGRILPDIVSRLAPDTPYVRDSSLPGLLGVFDGRAAATTSFVTAYGFNAFHTQRRYAEALLPDDMDFGGEAFRAHALSDDAVSDALSLARALFRVPRDFADTLLLSQLAQSVSCKNLFERWRRSGPRFGGAFLSRLVDCWPGIDPSSLDADGGWKCLHHFMKRFYSNLLVSAVPSAKNGTIDVFLHNDSASPFTGKIAWHMIDVSGKVWRQMEREISVPPGGPRRLGVIKLGDLLAKTGPSRLFVFLRLVAQDGFVFSTECVRFVTPKNLELEDPEVRFKASKHDDHSFDVVIDAKKPAPWCWLEFPACQTRFDSNFFSLLPGKQVKVRVTPIDNFALQDFLRALRVRTLFDTLPK